MNLKINNKIYELVHTIDISKLPHTGQCLNYIIVFKGKGGSLFNLIVLKGCIWNLYDKRGKNIVHGDHFYTFLEDTKQEFFKEVL